MSEFEYRLRAGPPFNTTSGYVVQSFRSEVRDIITSPCTGSLPSGGSVDGGGFNRIPVSGETLYTGSTVGETKYVDEVDFTSGSSSESSFIDCDTISIQYGEHNFANVSYVVISDSPLEPGTVPTPSDIGSLLVYNLTCKKIPRTDWYTISVSGVSNP
jgi:hypothetical protein